MPVTDRATDVSQEITRRLENWKDHLKVEDVYYGDQNLIPRFPTICVESGSTSRVLDGAGGKGRTSNNFRVYIMVYVAKLEDQQANRLNSELLGEAVMDVLHEDVTMGGLVVHGYVTEIAPGYTTRGKSLIRAVRITWQGLSKTLIA